MIEFRRKAFEAMKRHAAAAYPLEGCGLLVGVGAAGGRVVVIRAEPARNVERERPHDRYELDPRDYMRVDREAAQAGLEVVGFYHSHPDGPAIPSQTDVERSWPGFRYVIVAVQRGTPVEVRGWVFSPDRRAYQEQPVEVVDE